MQILFSLIMLNITDNDTNPKMQMKLKSSNIKDKKQGRAKPREESYNISAEQRENKKENI